MRHGEVEVVRAENTFYEHSGACACESKKFFLRKHLRLRKEIDFSVPYSAVGRGAIRKDEAEAKATVDETEERMPE